MNSHSVTLFELNSVLSELSTEGFCERFDAMLVEYRKADKSGVNCNFARFAVVASETEETLAQSGSMEGLLSQLQTILGTRFFGKFAEVYDAKYPT